MSQTMKTTQPAPNVVIQQMPLNQSHPMASAGMRQPPPQFTSPHFQQQQMAPQQGQIPFSPGQQPFSPASQQMHQSQYQQQVPSPYFHQQVTPSPATPASVQPHDSPMRSGAHLPPPSVGKQYNPPSVGGGPPSVSKPPLQQMTSSAGGGGVMRSGGTNAAWFNGGHLVDMMNTTEELSPLALSRLGKELSQEALNRLVDLFNISKSMDAPNPGVNAVSNERYQLAKSQRQMKLDQFQQLLSYLQKIVAKISEIKEKLEEHEKELGFDARKLSEDELLSLLMGKPLGKEAEETKNSQEYKELEKERERLESELKIKREKLIDVSDFLRSLEWQLGAVME